MENEISITVSGCGFSYPARFHAGHTLSDAEAAVLNSVVAKRLRAAIVSGKVSTRAEAVAFVEGAPLAADELAGLSIGSDDLAGLSVEENQ